MDENLKDKVKHAPNEPGCYLFKDVKGNPINQAVPSGGVTSRYDINGEVVPAELECFMKEGLSGNGKDPDCQLKECLQHISADKAVIILPLKKNLQSRIDLISEKVSTLSREGRFCPSP